MDNWCVFCGEPIEDGELYCDQCEDIVQDLTPEQRKAFDELIKDEKDREELAAALNGIIEAIHQAIEPLGDVICHLIDKVCDEIYGREDDGQT